VDVNHLAKELSNGMSLIQVCNDAAMKTNAVNKILITAARMKFQFKKLFWLLDLVLPLTFFSFFIEPNPPIINSWFCCAI